MVQARRSLGFLLVLSPVAPARGEGEPAISEPRGGAGVGFFADDQDTTIYSPHASAGATLPAEVQAQATWAADFITSASVDIVTAATTHMEETRHELGLTLRRETIARGLDVDGGYLYSFERDADSHTAQAGLRQRLLGDSLDVQPRYGFS